MFGPIHITFFKNCLCISVCWSCWSAQGSTLYSHAPMLSCAQPPGNKAISLTSKPHLVAITFSKMCDTESNLQRSWFWVWDNGLGLMSCHWVDTAGCSTHELLHPSVQHTLYQSSHRDPTPWLCQQGPVRSPAWLARGHSWQSPSTPSPTAT